MSNELILSLAKKAMNATTQTTEARKEALRHICRLRGEPVAPVDSITEDELYSIAVGMTAWSATIPGLHDLTLADALDALREGRRRRAERHITKR